ncbi:hypothetical protein [Tenacibaculum sp. 190524A05c]|uniref:hypothetical protein n=1 Tax=Tenacibaculum platacis TaxID=3137852 RepID=UPI0031FB31D1
MFRKVFGLILLMLGIGLLFSPQIISEVFYVVGFGEGKPIFEFETLMFILINFICYTFVFYIIYEGFQLIKGKKTNNA